MEESFSVLDAVKVQSESKQFPDMEDSESDVLTTTLPTEMFQNDLDATRRLMSTMSPDLKRALEVSREPGINHSSDRTSLDFLETEKVRPLDEIRVGEVEKPLVAPAKSIKSSPTDKPLSKVMSDVWGGVRRMLGLKKAECKNGGQPVGESCKCSIYFEGQFCEKRVCLNGGQLTKSNVLPISFDCKCSNPLYVEGVHCEVVKCANRAPLITHSNGTWTCDCADSYFFSGQYCERFEASYTAAGVVLLGLVLLIMCCGLCRIDWCPRRRRNNQRHSDSTRIRGRDAGRHLPTSNPRIVTGRQTQEFLLPRNPLCDRNGLCVRSVQGPPFVIRLDTIPTFNPDMIGGVEPDDNKPMEPPPSYDQALSAPIAPQPPSYTETDDLHLQTPYQHPSAPR